MARFRNRAAFSLMLALTAVAGMAGCTTDAKSGEVLSLDQRAERVPMQADEFGKLGYRVEWRGFATMLPGAQIVNFDVLGDVLAVQDSKGVLTILENSSGAQRWSDQVSGPLTRFLGAVRDSTTIMVASESEVFYYDAATGALKNKQSMTKVANTHPAKIADILVFGTGTGQVIGHQTGNGFALWGSAVNGAVEFEPVVFAGKTEAAIASAGGDLLVFEGTGGRGIARAKMFGGPGAAPAVSENAVYIASVDHSLYAFDHLTGSQIWRHRTDAPLRKAPVYIDGKVYCDLGESGGMTAFDGLTGKVIWQNKKVSGEVVAVRKGKLVVFSGETASTLDIAKGAVIDSVALQNIKVLKSVPMKDGTLYAVSPLGVIAKMSPK